MISRILARLAIVWLVCVGGVLLTVALFIGHGQADWSVIAAVVLVPPAGALALAWVFAPRT